MVRYNLRVINTGVPFCGATGIGVQEIQYGIKAVSNK